MHIRDWPEDERPREKLAARGAAALSDAELLAIFIGSGPRGRSAVDLGRELLQPAGLRGLLDRPVAELARLHGLGPARACALAAALELGTRHLGQQLQRGEALADPDQAGTYFQRKLRPLPHEVFACLFLDTRHRVLAYEELFRGTLDGSGFPLGWLCPKMTAAALCARQRRATSRGCTSEPSRVPRNSSS